MDIFISYKREDLARVQPLVTALRGAGLGVWWDQDIAPDAPWEATIERELSASKVAIVAWSTAAVTSENVRAEAREARDAGKLIQVFVERCKPPLFFGERQAVDLSNWDGDTGDQRFFPIILAVKGIGGIDIEWPAATPMPLSSSPPTGEVVKGDPSAASAFADRGRSRLEEQEYDEALTDFDEAIRRDSAIAEELQSSVVEAFTNRGRHHLDNWEYSDALDDFGEAIRLDPDAAEELKPDVVAAYVGRGRERLGDDDLDEAFEDFDEALRLDPNVVQELKEEIADAFGNRVRVRLEECDYTGAIDAFQDAVVRDPDLAEPLKSEILQAITAALEC